MHYALPFIILALAYLVWAFSAYLLKDKFPRYYEWVCLVNDKLPNIIAVAVITLFMYYYFGIDGWAIREK